MKLKLIVLILVATVSSPFPVTATEYIFRDLMANSLPSPGCNAESEALKKATKPYTIDNYSKRFCQTQGYGWHVAEIKDQGKAVCENCSGSSDGLKKCHVEDIVVTCKRIKPGSVGMLPGKS